MGGFNARRRTGIMIWGLVFAVTCCLAAAQAKPNFSGNWKMNGDKSDFGAFPGPTSRTDKIDHKDPSLKLTTNQSGAQGDITADLSYSTDGKETTNEIMGTEVKSTAHWDGNTLVIDSKANFGGADITLKDKWALAEDGKGITIDRHIVTPQGEVDQKIVMEKQ